MDVQVTEGAGSIEELVPRANEIVDERLQPWTLRGHAIHDAVWTCKVWTTTPHDEIPSGSDLPMREAVEAAATQLGATVKAVSSGWGGRLEEADRAVDERRLPNVVEVEAEVLARILCLPVDSVIRRKLGV